MTDEEKDRYRALVVVNWEFPSDKSGELQPLEGPRHDALALTAALTDGEFGLFHLQNVRVCTNESADDVREAFEALIDEAGSDDTVLFYYSGHGTRFRNNLYLCTRNTDGKRPFSSGIDARTISQYIEESGRARKTIVVLDCCYAGGFGAKGSADVLEPLDSLFGEGEFILASSREFEPSSDSAERGLPSPFTSALCDVLTSAQLAGTNGALTIQQVYDNLDQRYQQKQLKARPYKRDRGSGSIRIAKRSMSDRQGKDYRLLTQKLVLEAEDDEFYSVAISPDGKTIAAGTDGAVLLWKGDTEVWRWDPANPPKRQPLELRHDDTPLHRSYVYSVAFSPDGKLLASSDEQGQVRVTSLDGRAVLEGEHREAVYSVAFTSDGRFLASGSWDRRVIVWDLESGTYRWDAYVDSRVSCLAFSPNAPQPLLAIACLDNSVKLWDVRRDTPHALGIAHTSSVEAVAFSFDGSLLASCGLDKSVRVWDVHNSAELWCQTRHAYLVRSVAFAPDGETLVSASWDKSMKLWESWTGNLDNMPSRRRWQEHTDWIWAVTFSSDGNAMASAGSDGRIIIWSLPDSQRTAVAGRG